MATGIPAADNDDDGNDDGNDDDNDDDNDDVPLATVPARR